MHEPTGAYVFETWHLTRKAYMSVPCLNTMDEFVANVFVNMLGTLVTFEGCLKHVK